jgi:hypothetical protein
MISPSGDHTSFTGALSTLTKTVQKPNAAGAARTIAPLSSRGTVNAIDSPFGHQVGRAAAGGAAARQCTVAVAVVPTFGLPQEAETAMRPARSETPSRVTGST